MNKEPYKSNSGVWIYPELPDGVRPANEQDLFLYNGEPRYGKRILHRCFNSDEYIAARIGKFDTKEDLIRMLKDKIVYVKK